MAGSKAPKNPADYQIAPTPRTDVPGWESVVNPDSPSSADSWTRNVPGMPGMVYVQSPGGFFQNSNLGLIDPSKVQTITDPLTGQQRQITPQNNFVIGKESGFDSFMGKAILGGILGVGLGASGIFSGTLFGSVPEAVMSQAVSTGGAEAVTSALTSAGVPEVVGTALGEAGGATGGLANTFTGSMMGAGNVAPAVIGEASFAPAVAGATGGALPAAAAATGAGLANQLAGQVLQNPGSTGKNYLEQGLEQVGTPGSTEPAGLGTPSMTPSASSGFNLLNLLKGVLPSDMFKGVASYFQQKGLSGDLSEIAKQSADYANAMNTTLYPQRKAPQDQLESLLADPNNYLKSAYPTAVSQFMLKSMFQAQQAKSGNFFSDLDKTSSQLASTLSSDYNQRLQTLGTLGGYDKGAGYAGNVFGNTAAQGAQYGSMGVNALTNVGGKVADNLWNALPPLNSWF